MKNNYFIIHGSFGSPFVNWVPYIRKKIEEKNGVVYTPDFPTGVGYQNYDNWNKLLSVYLDAGLINENTVIFAHSIAPIFICHFLVEHRVKIKRLVFVCGFNNYLKDVRNYADEIICFYSKNDPYVKYEAEKEFADTIATKQIVIDNGEHLNSESGYTEFTELLKYI